MPYQPAGSAPGTPAAARRANCVAAQARTESLTAPCGAHTTPRSRPTTAAADSTLGAVTGAASATSVAQRAISAKNGDGMLASPSPLASPAPLPFYGRDQQPFACPTHRGHQQPPLLGEQRCTHRGAFGEPVQHVQQSLSTEHPATRNCVGPQPFLQSGDDYHVPLVAERRVRAEHRHLVGRGRGIGASRLTSAERSGDR